MASTIIHKKSSVVTDGKAKLPTSSAVTYGELAVNYADGYETIAIKNTKDEIVEFKSKDYVDNLITNVNNELDGLEQTVSGLSSNLTNLSGSTSGFTAHKTTSANTNALGHVKLVTGDVSTVTATTKGLATSPFHNHDGKYVNKTTYENEFSALESVVDTKAASSHNHGTLELTGDAEGSVTISSGTSKMTLDVVVKDNSHSHSAYTLTSTTSELANMVDGHDTKINNLETHNHGKLILSGDVTGTTTITSGTGDITLGVMVKNDSHTHISTNITDSISVSSAITTGESKLVQAKAVKSLVDTEVSALNTKIDSKANATHNHASADITGTVSTSGGITTASSALVQAKAVKSLADTKADKSALNTLSASVTSLTTTVSGIDARLGTAEGEIDTLQSTVSSHTTSISNLNSNKADKSALNAATASTNQLSGVVSGLSTTVAAHATELGNKYDKTGGTVSGNVTVSGTISGTTVKSPTIYGTTITGATITGTNVKGTTAVYGATICGTTIYEGGTSLVNKYAGKAYESRVSANETAISELEGDISSLTTTVGSHTTTINKLTGDVLTIQNLLNEDENSVIDNIKDVINFFSGATEDVSGAKELIETVAAHETAIGGKVSKTGDTMSGNLTVSATISGTSVKSPTIHGTTITGGTITGTNVKGNTAVYGATVSGVTIKGTTITGATICGTTIYEGGTKLADKYAPVHDHPYAPSSHTGSVATTAATGHVKISNGDVATVAHADGLVAGMDHSHSNYMTTDTKNTAGSTNSTSKLFLIGSTSQTASSQTYSNSNCYTQSNYLYSNGEKVDMRLTTSLVPIGTAIPEGTDLNTLTYLKVGKYYCSANKTVETFKNCPIKNAFMMEVFSPLSTTIDDENTNWCYRLRRLTSYTGYEFIQYCYSNGSAVWTYGTWYLVPKNSVALTSGGTVAGGEIGIGNANTPIYINSSGFFVTGNTFSTTSHNHGTLKLTGDVTGSATITSGTGEMSLTTTVADDSHYHTVSTISGGSANQVMVSQGTNSAKWVNQNTLSAGTASKWSNSRTITLNGDVTGSITIDGSANVTATTTVVNDSHTHDSRYYTETEADSRFVPSSHTGSLATTAATGHVMVGSFLSVDTTGKLSVSTGTSSSTVARGDHSHSGYSPTGHTHDDRYVNVTGDTMTGCLSIETSAWNNQLTLTRNNNGSNWGPAISFYDENGGRGCLTMGDDKLYICDVGGTTSKRKEVSTTDHKHNLSQITAGTITLNGDVTGTITMNGTNAITVTTTVANDSHTHKSANISDAVTAITSNNSASTALVQTKAVCELINENEEVVAQALVDLDERVTDLDVTTVSLRADLTSTTNATKELNQTLEAHATTSANSSTLGHVKVGSFLSSNAGVISVLTGTSNSTVARGDHSHSNYSSTGHTHDDRYYTETEADGRFVNASGDTMTGQLNVPTLSATTISGTTIKGTTITGATICGTTIYENGTSLANKYSLTSHTHSLSSLSSTAHTHSYLPLSGGNLTGDVDMEEAMLVIRDSSYFYMNELSPTGMYISDSDGNSSSMDSSRIISPNGNFTNLTATTVSGTTLRGTSAYTSILSATTISGVTIRGSSVSASTISGSSIIVSPTISGTTIKSPTLSATTICATTMYATSGFYETSDERLKNFKGKIPVSLERLSHLKKNYFTWKDKDEEDIQIGVSAQEVQSLYPEIVSESDSGSLTVAYDKLSVVALSAIDVLYEENKTLKDKISKLESQIENINTLIEKHINK